MLKPKFSFKRTFSFLSFLIVSTVLFSCKSVPVQEEAVEAISLLDNDSSFYIRIPSACDEVLVQRIITNSVKGIADSDAELIASRIRTVYAGMNRSKKGTDFQISLDSDFPPMFVSKALTKKNGFEKQPLLAETSDGISETYTVYNNQKLLLSFPSQNNCVVGRNVPAMIEKFHFLKNHSSDYSYQLNSDVYDWLNVDGDENAIKYFASKPQSFLTMLTGANLNFRLVYVKGIMTLDPKHSDQYLMDLEFEFRDAKFLPAAKGALSVAFGLTDSDVLVSGETHLKITKIKISKQQLYSIFTL